MPTEINRATGGGGTGTDPCAGYPDENCSGPIPTADKFQLIGQDPNTFPRDSNGCAGYGGCWVTWGNVFFQWAGWSYGYVQVSPTGGAKYIPKNCGPAPSKGLFVSTPNNPNGNKQPDGGVLFTGCYLLYQGMYYEWDDATRYYKFANPATTDSHNCPTQAPDIGGFRVMTTNPFARNVSTGEAPFWGCFVSYQGATYRWVDSFIGYEAIQPLTTIDPGGGGINPTGGGGITPPTGTGDWITPMTALVNAVLGQVLNAANPTSKSIDKQTTAFQVHNSDIVDYIKETNGTANDYVALLASHFTVQNDSLVKAERERLESFNQRIDVLTAAVKDALFGTGAAPDPTQAAYNESGKDFFYEAKNALDLLNGSGSDQIAGILKTAFGGVLAGPLQEVVNASNSFNVCLEGLLKGEFKTLGEFEECVGSSAPIMRLLFAVGNIAAIASLVTRFAVIAADPIANELSQLANAQSPTKVLDAGSIQEAFKRSEWTQADSVGELAKQGLNADRAALLLKLSEVFAPMGLIEEGVLRGKITPEDGAMWLSQQGFSLDTIKAIVSLYEKIPTPQDIIRIADKRVWAGQTDPKYGQYSELPEELVNYLAQWGYPRQWAEWLWAAHWQLPSAQQIYDMFHRGKINEEDIGTFLGLTDWLPYFRDGLLAISYNVPTRVDTRRALHAGIITENQALEYHKAQGYTPQDAAVLVELDKQTSTTDQVAILVKLKTRIIGHVESAYGKGQIDRTTATSHLIALGYDPGTAQLALDVIDHERGLAGVPDKTASHTQAAIDKVLHAFGKGTLGFTDAQEYLTILGMSLDHARTELNIQEIDRQAALKQKWADTAVKLYGEHTIEYTGFTDMLGSQGFGMQEISQLAQEAELARVLRTKRPSEAEYKLALKKGLIDQVQFQQGMRGLGYADQFMQFLTDVALA